MIEVRNLTKRYGKNIAVDNLSFKVEKGQIYGFLGPNGAGKSTTMNIITGYLAASEGDVIVNGHDILKEPRAARASIGYLPELPPLYQEMTVSEYLTFAAELKTVAKAEREDEVQRVMGILQLGEMGDRLIKNLSKGYKQRVGFAQALLGSPDILILDEPTVGLDPKQIIEIRSLIRDLGSQHTVILSSHILSEVSEICDHIMIMSKGKLVASSSAEDLMKEMQPVTVLKITAIADDASANQVMETIEGLTEYSIQPSLSDESAVDITVKYDSADDRRSEISAAFGAAGCAIIQMNKEMTSLEDVFLELTSGEHEPVYAESPVEESSAGEAAGTSVEEELELPVEEVPEEEVEAESKAISTEEEIVTEQVKEDTDDSDL